MAVIFMANAFCKFSFSCNNAIRLHFSFLSYLLGSEQPNVNTVNFLLILLDLPINVKSVIEGNLLTVTKNYITSYTGNSQPTLVSEEDLLKMTPGYKDKMKALAEANSASGVK